jgi:hypothetical protein
MLEITQTRLHGLFHFVKSTERLIPHATWVSLFGMKIFYTGLGGNRETGRHGNLQVGHFGQPRPLSTQEFFHISRSFSFTATEEIDVFFLPHVSLSFTQQGPLDRNEKNEQSTTRRNEGASAIDKKKMATKTSPAQLGQTG